METMFMILNLIQEYLQRERLGSARLDNFASGLELIGQKVFVSWLYYISVRTKAFSSMLKGNYTVSVTVSSHTRTAIPKLLTNFYLLMHNCLGFQLQMDTLQSRLDAEFLLAHMCSVKFKEWIVVLATLLRRAEVWVPSFNQCKMTRTN